MTNLISLPCHDESGHFHIVVEAPRGSLIKFKYEPSLRTFVFNRALPLGVAYPYTWGFVPSTRCEDGDPLDAMVLLEAPTWPGIVIPSKAIGVLRVRQRSKTSAKEVRNDRVIAAPADDERYSDVTHLSSGRRRQLEDFFVTVAKSGGKEVNVEGWDGPLVAEKLIADAVRAYQNLRSDR